MRVRHVYLAFVALTVSNAVTAVLAGRHFFLDGPYFFLRIVQRGGVNTADSFRIAHHLLLHGPTALAVRFGVSDWRLLSLIFGAGVFGVPLALVVLAVRRLLYARQEGLALLMIGSYALASSFTGLFIVSESHLAMGLFFLSLAMLQTGALSGWKAKAPLLAMCAIAAFCYEFWVVYALVCLGVLCTRIRKDNVVLRENGGVALLALGYIGVFAVNLRAIVLTTHAPNRDAMIASTLENLGYVVPVVALCGILAAVVLGIVPFSRGAGGRPAGRGVLGWSIVGAGALAGWFGFDVVSPVSEAYTLRGLNFFLPLLFAGGLLVTSWRSTKPSPWYSLPAVAGLVSIVACAQIRHTTEWLAYTRAMSSALSAQHGYVQSDALRNPDRRYDGFWSSPALSIVLQSLGSHEIRSIAFNPKASWQPFGPPLCESPRPLALRYAIRVDPSISPDAPECHASAP